MALDFDIVARVFNAVSNDGLSVKQALKSTKDGGYKVEGTDADYEEAVEAAQKLVAAGNRWPAAIHSVVGGGPKLGLVKAKKSKKAKKAALIKLQ